MARHYVSTSKSFTHPQKLRASTADSHVLFPRAAKECRARSRSSPAAPQRGLAPATQRGCLGGCPERVPLLAERAVVAARGRAAIPPLRQPPVGMTECAVLRHPELVAMLVHISRALQKERFANGEPVPGSLAREPVRRPEAMSTSFALLTSLRMTPKRNDTWRLNRRATRRDSELVDQEAAKFRATERSQRKGRGANCAPAFCNR